MTFSNTNLEKLIQMATIEQMYSMLQKLKENVDNLNESNFEEKKKTTNLNVSAELVTEIKNVQVEIQNITDNLQKYNDNILKLNTKILELEKELYEIKSNTNNNSKFLCQQIRGQQSLTSYPGFSNGPQKEKYKEEPNIKLKIEEKALNNTNIDTQSLCVLEKKLRETCISEEDADDEDDEDDEDKEDEDKEDDEDDDKEDDEDDDKDAEEKDEEEKQVEKDETDEEESEDEVGTDEEEKEDLEKEIQNVKQVVEKEIQNVKQVEVVEEEEEEVFEIEIDDITYFVTDEENGILYESTSDGDIGKKVGIIKNGEPIFVK